MVLTVLDRSRNSLLLVANEL